MLQWWWRWWQWWPGALPDNEVTKLRGCCKAEVCSSGWQQHVGCSPLLDRICLLPNFVAAMSPTVLRLAPRAGGACPDT